ncbi:replication initiator protein A [Sneathiella aquimaris]|uniref:replication initiator protein A n=1 Tax=Sneathiella aquimaris TaxID=2599305 RepID=UPI00146E985C|nr:replication initiator protein A [Sneathiella aquimaris]
MVIDKKNESPRVLNKAFQGFLDRMPVEGETCPPAANDNKPPEQPDLFVPSLHDIPIKDNIDLMDIAVFRLSTKQKVHDDMIVHDLPNARVEVTGNARYGIATIHDYDIVLMAVSQLTNAVMRYRNGYGPRPSNVFRIHSTEVFKFRRTGAGGKDYERLESALNRLQGTFIKIERKGEKGRLRRTGYFPLIAGAKVVSHTSSGRIGTLEITIPDWICDGIMKHEKPEVLTIHPEYFGLKIALAKFISRFVRKQAGQTEALWGFRKIQEKSQLVDPEKKFNHKLREVIKANPLPDYDLLEVSGKDGPMLRMMPKGKRGVEKGGKGKS